jgi:glucokinase
LFWYDEPIGELFEKYLDHKVLIAQDSRNGVIAEMLFGAGKGYSDILLITLGTGIGCGIIINKKLFCGAMNTAGELGHMPIVKNGRSCVCGNKGCLERYASGTGILEGALEKFPNKFLGMEKTCENVFKMVYKGDNEIYKYIDECVDNLAFGIANAVSLFSAEAVIISGGLCVHEDLIVKPLEEKVYKHGYYSWTHLKRLKIHKALLGSDAPMIGASMLYQFI